MRSMGPRKTEQGQEGLQLREEPENSMSEAAGHIDRQERAGKGAASLPRGVTGNGGAHDICQTVGPTGNLQPERRCV